MISFDIEVVRNDKLFELIFEIDNADNTDLDLTDATVLFKAWMEGEDTNQITGTCTITEATEGKCKYLVQDGDLDRSGDFFAELEVTYTSGKVITASGIKMRILDDAPE